VKALPLHAGSHYQRRDCHLCNGTGWLVESRSYEYATGKLTLVEIVCHACDGLGSEYVFIYPTSTTTTTG
jgi:DnaJ-class molecular chaperone